MTALSPSEKFSVDYSIICPDLDKHVEPYPFFIMNQEKMSMAFWCNPETMTLDEAMYQTSKDKFVKKKMKKN